MEFDDPSFWRNLAAAPIEFNQSLIWRASIRPYEFCQFISAVRERDIDRFSTSVWQAGIAEGRLRMIAREQGPVQVSELKVFRDMAQSLGGSLIIENASTQTKTGIDPWGHGSSQTVLKRIKDALDPDGIFSPGRF